MATDLDALRDGVEALLMDAGNAEWSTAELDQAIRLALADVSRELPRVADATLHAVHGQWEYDLSSLDGLQQVLEVWYPYLPDDAPYQKAHPVCWRLLDDATLYLDVADDPDATYHLRIFYTKQQSLAGLDGATETTLSPLEKAALVIGAAGYAAVAKARDWMNEVTIGLDVPRTLQRWGERRLAEFERRLATLAQLATAGDDARVSGWA
ncbi:MAG: hypothetical protein ACUVR2_11810 [Anaerolineae bacterium]